MDTFTQAYIEAMLWSSTLPPYGECPECGMTKVLDRWNDEDEHVCDGCSSREPNYEPPADQNYWACDISEGTMTKIIADCEKFQSEANLDEGTLEQAGHDFWLTRNGHGAGFWDGDWPVSGDELTKLCKSYGEFYLYVGDDGRIYS